MKNPLNNISIFEITTEDNDNNVVIKYDGYEMRRCIVPITWGKTGVARAWYGYSNESLAVAGGYGYDKESQALSQAVEKLTGESIGGYGAGWGQVVGLAGEKGITIKKII
jgi:hypothetical protein